MNSKRLISLAAGVIPELMRDPARFVEVTAGAGWKATGVWFDQESWSSTTSREVKRRIDDNGIEAVDMELFDLGEVLIQVRLSLKQRCRELKYSCRFLTPFF